VTGSPEPGDVTDAAGQTSSAGGPAVRQSASIVATGILLSRISGLIRDSIFAQYLGTSPFASAFRAALRMPNVLQNLLGEGTLSASFIPVYVELLEHDRRAAGRLAGTVFALLLAAAAALALIGVTFAPLIVRLFFPGFEGELLSVTIRAVRVTFPMAGVLVLSAWALGILNSHRRFLVSYTAPVAWNVAIIAALVGFGGTLMGADLVIAACWGAFVGGVLQLAVQLPWVLRLERSLRIGDLASPAVRRVLDNAGPAVLGRGVVQISAWVDMVLASYLFAGAVAVIGFAQTLYVLPVSLFGMAVAAAELPEMSRQAGGPVEALRERLESGLRGIAILVIPSAVGYFAIGDVIVAAIYQGGQFERLDTLIVWIVLGAYSVGLFASTSTRLYSSAFYALQDTRRPAIFAGIRVLVAALLGGTFMLIAERYAIVLPFEIVPNTGDIETARPLGAAGLALGAGMAAWIEWTLLRRGIQRRVGGLESGATVLIRLLIAAAIPAAAIRLVLVPALGAISPRVVALIALPAYGTAYFAIAIMLGVPGVRDTVDRVVRRFGGRRRGA
jgi:putative peptidoglycan lipid II flippase